MTPNDNPYESPSDTASSSDTPPPAMARRSRDLRAKRRKSPFADSARKQALWWTLGIAVVVGPAVYIAIQIPAVTRGVIFFGTLFGVIFVLRPKRSKR